MRALTATAAFLRRDDGSQPVEYALVIALVSIVLSIALGNTMSGLGSTLVDLATRVAACFAPAAVSC